MLVVWLSVLFSASTERKWSEKGDSQLRRSFPGLVAFLNAMFGERTGSAFLRFDSGAKAVLFEQDQVFKADFRIEFSVGIQFFSPDGTANLDVSRFAEDANLHKFRGRTDFI